jgi:urease accessory protein
MRRHASPILALAAAAALVPSAAFAHTGVGAHAAGFVHGFVHPVSGLDHVLAMVLVGMLAWQLGGRALVVLPAAFLGLMAAGGALAITGVNLPLAELGIALSVVALGAAVALRFRAPVAFAAAAVGLFATFHGYAHGAEMPATALGFAYGAGFLLGTTLLHAAGIGLGALMAWTGDRGGPILLRAAGAASALAGVAILTGLV